MRHILAAVGWHVVLHGTATPAHGCSTFHNLLVFELRMWAHTHSCTLESEESLRLVVATECGPSIASAGCNCNQMIQMWKVAIIAPKPPSALLSSRLCVDFRVSHLIILLCWVLCRMQGAGCICFENVIECAFFLCSTEAAWTKRGMGAVCWEEWLKTVSPSVYLQVVASKKLERKENKTPC